MSRTTALRGNRVRAILITAAVLSATVVGTLLIAQFREGERPRTLAEESSHTTDPPTGDILITLRDGSDHLRLFVVAADGSATRQLIAEDSVDGDQITGTWSPDGSMVAVTVQSGSASDIYIVNTDGGGLRQLAPATLSQHYANWILSQADPAWSPDGSTIAFASNRAEDRGALDIYVVRADGSNLQRLTDGDLFEFSPRWSPDGTMIAYEAIGGGGDHYGNVYVMNADGSNQRRLIETTAAGDPDWSPDGESIAYRDGRFCCAGHIVHGDGTDRRDLTPPGVTARWLRWSPDGTRLAWSAHDNGGSLDGILILNVQSGSTRLVTNLTGKIEWSPDGDWLAVAMPAISPEGEPTGAGGLYLVKPDGSEQRLLREIDVDEYDVMLDWRP